MLVIPKAWMKALADGNMVIGFPRAYGPELKQFATGSIHLTLGRPQKPKKTGEHSRLNLVHRWFRDIADQLSVVDPDIDEAKVKEAMKRMACTEGWPTALNPIDGKEEPMGIRWASESHMALLVRVVSLYADLNGLYLSQGGDTAEDNQILKAMPWNKEDNDVQSEE